MSDFSHTMEVEIAGAWVRVDFDYSCSPSYPASGPTYSSGGEPAGGGEVEIDKATLNITNGDKTEKVDAPAWLMAIFHADTDLADTLRENAEEDSGPDPDARYDAMRDEG